MNPFKRYIALGDSISIDLYPALDKLSELGRRERGLGAASLFFRNHDELFPDFQRRDLTTLMPGIAFRNHHEFSSPSSFPTDNLTYDGATTGDVLVRQLPRLAESDELTLVTLNAGGNDMLSFLGATQAPVDLVRGMIERIHQIVIEVRRRLRRSTILLGTVYDPSDGTNLLDGQRYDREAVWLQEFNESIRALHDPTTGIRVADIHKHFLGRGVTVPERERWYWSGLVFEPNAVGAGEVRRLWLECLSL